MAAQLPTGPLRHFFHQAILTVFIAQSVDPHGHGSAKYPGYPDTQIRIYAQKIQHGKKDQQANRPAAEIPDILCLKPFELNGFVNSLIDLIYTVSHFSDPFSFSPVPSHSLLFHNYIPKLFLALY